MQVPRRMPSDRSTACEGGPALPAYFLVSVFRVHEPSFDPTTSSARFPEKECPDFGPRVLVASDEGFPRTTPTFPREKRPAVGSPRSRAFGTCSRGGHARWPNERDEGDRGAVSASGGERGRRPYVQSVRERMVGAGNRRPPRPSPRRGTRARRTPWALVLDTERCDTILALDEAGAIPKRRCVVPNPDAAVCRAARTHGAHAVEATSHASSSPTDPSTRSSAPPPPPRPRGPRPDPGSPRRVSRRDWMRLARLLRRRVEPRRSSTTRRRPA